MKTAMVESTVMEKGTGMVGTMRSEYDDDSDSPWLKIGEATTTSTMTTITVRQDHSDERS
jgi:hypothetical protein